MSGAERRDQVLHLLGSRRRLAPFLRDRSCYRYRVLYLAGETKDRTGKEGRREEEGTMPPQDRARKRERQVQRMTYGSRPERRPLYLDSKVRAQRASCYDINGRLSSVNYLSMCTRRAIDRDSRTSLHL